MLASTVYRRVLPVVGRSIRQQKAWLVESSASVHSGGFNDDSSFNRDTPAQVSLPDTMTGMIQAAQGREHEFSANRSKDTVDFQANDVESAMSNSSDPMDNVDEHAQHHDDSCNVSLYSVMQSNVPEPYSRNPTHLNMPGTGTMQRQKFENNRRVDVGGSRCYHTSSMYFSQGMAEPNLPFGSRPDAQGVQGDPNDAALFDLWLNNCTHYNLDCDKMIEEYKAGRKTLQQIFAEQDELILKAVEQQKQEVCDGKSVEGVSSSSGPPNKPSQTERLKAAVKQYGSTVIVFHVGISLISLGGFYALVSSGIDMVSLLEKAGIGESLLRNNLVSGASTFVVAYAVHKVFAPVRIAITLTSTPFIVRYLRSVGFIKAPKV